MLPTQTPPVHCPSRDDYFWLALFGLHPHSRDSTAGSTLSRLISVVHFHCGLLVRPEYLLSTPLRSDAVGTCFGAEPSNCTGGTFTRVGARFTSAPKVVDEEIKKGASFQ